MELFAFFFAWIVVVVAVQIPSALLAGSRRGLLFVVNLVEVIGGWALLQAFDGMAMWGMFVGILMSAGFTICIQLYLVHTEYRLKCDWGEITPMSTRIRRWFSDQWNKIFHHDHHPSGKVFT